MAALLTIDQGNTAPHVGLYEQGQLQQVMPWEQVNTNQIGDYDAIYSGVGSPDSPILQRLQQATKRWIDIAEHKRERQFLDMPVNYSLSLGTDRLALAYYVFKQKPSKRSLIIDAGTFTKIDLVSGQGFEGGYIFPGLSAYFSLYSKGARLPKPELHDFKLAPDIPHDTQAAITQSFALLNSQVFHYLISKHQVEQLILSGGQHSYFLPMLEPLNVPTEVQAQLIHHALAFIFKQLV